jgi:SAM-dependent methyltransferase
MSDIESLFYPEKRAGGFSRCSGTVQFFQRVQALLSPGDIVLDFGAGRGKGHHEDVPYAQRLRNLRGEDRRVIGIDVDPLIAANPGLDEWLVLEPGASLPFRDMTFDVIVSDFVFEHISDAAGVSGELDRVLKPGGWLCVRTTNRNGYVAIANRITPERFRKRLILAAHPENKESDIFTPYYRMNTLRELRRLFPFDRYQHAVFGFDSEPQYHFNRRLMFLALMVVHALTPPSFRNTLMCFLHKRVAVTT